jgi:DNA-binding CsgD family transcriptional regulator
MGGKADGEAPRSETTPERSPPPPEHVARVLSADVQAIIEKRLVRAGIPEQEREDFQQEVTKDLLYMADPPGDLEGCSKAAHDITRKKVAGARRQAYRRGETNVGPTDQADNHAQQDARELANGHHAQKIAVVQEAMSDGTMSERDAQMLAMKREGHTDAQIAAKIGIAPQTVSNRIATVRKKVREKWQVRMTQLAALSLAVVVAILVWRRREEIASFFRGPTPGPAPAPTQTAPPAPEPSIPVARAAELRRQAAEACEQRDYKTCSDRLEEAAKLDPAGDKEPSVRELRHQVEDNVRFERPNEAKPGYPR